MAAAATASPWPSRPASCVFCCLSDVPPTLLTDRSFARRHHHGSGKVNHCCQEASSRQSRTIAMRSEMLGILACFPGLHKAPVGLHGLGKGSPMDRRTHRPRTVDASEDTSQKVIETTRRQTSALLRMLLETARFAETRHTQDRRSSVLGGRQAQHAFDPPLYVRRRGASGGGSWIGPCSVLLELDYLSVENALEPGGRCC